MRLRPPFARSGVSFIGLEPLEARALLAATVIGDAWIAPRLRLTTSQPPPTNEDQGNAGEGVPDDKVTSFTAVNTDPSKSSEHQPPQQRIVMADDGWGDDESSYAHLGWSDSYLAEPAAVRPTTIDCAGASADQSKHPPVRTPHRHTEVKGDLGWARERDDSTSIQFTGDLIDDNSTALIVTSVHTGQPLPISILPDWIFEDDDSIDDEQETDVRLEGADLGSAANIRRDFSNPAPAVKPTSVQVIRP